MRFKIYDKDPDFFTDTKTGEMYELRSVGAAPGTRKPEQRKHMPLEPWVFVETLVEAANLHESANLL